VAATRCPAGHAIGCTISRGHGRAHLHRAARKTLALIVMEFAPGIASEDAPHRDHRLHRHAVRRDQMDMDATTVNCGPATSWVQRGTNHAWVNRGTRPARLAIVLLDAKPSASATAPARRSGAVNGGQTLGSGRRWLTPQR